MIFINKKVMNIKRILISEQEKKDILSQYGVKKDVISEQTLNDDGTYTIKNLQEFTVHAIQYGGSAPRVYIKKGETVKKNTDGKSLSVDVYHKKEDSTGKFTGPLVKSEPKGKFICGDYLLRFEGSEQTYEQIVMTGQPFKTAMNKLFCDGNKLKSDKVVGGGGEEQKPKTDNRCKFVEKEFTNQQVCYIPNDKTWMYAKTDDGKWYTTKQTDKKTWCELTTPKFQKAIDKLNIECKGLEPISKLELKPIGTIETEKNLELVPSKQQMIDKGLEAAKFVSNLQNRPQ
jgi:hypothetical protein